MSFIGALLLAAVAGAVADTLFIRTVSIIDIRVKTAAPYTLDRPGHRDTRLVCLHFTGNAPRFAGLRSLNIASPANCDVAEPKRIKVVAAV
ncbi:MAG: hypothetical protein ACRENP_27575 [Longimicrobiales bacterium]